MSVPFLSFFQKENIKSKALVLFNYFPGLVVLILGLFALEASLVLMHENDRLHGIYQRHANINTSNLQSVEQVKMRIESEERHLYWSIWGLGLMGFVLVLMNANKLSRLSRANAEKADTVRMLKYQLDEIKKAEAEKTSLQDQLYQAQKLEAVGRLAGGIAHDFNNILAAMNGYAEFLIDDLDETTEHHVFASNILKAGKQARELVDQVLAFSRRDSNEIVLTNLVAAIEESVSMLSASLPKSIDLQVNIDVKDAFISGSPTALIQGIMNLSVNAKDAMHDDKGTLSIGVKAMDAGFSIGGDVLDALPDRDMLPLVRIDDVADNHTRLTLGALVKDQPYICLSVSDDGSGMTRVIMEHIFEPFFTTKDVNKGTGLGMAMVHSLVSTHSAAMVVDTRIGEGTCFDLYFPAADHDVTHDVVIDDNLLKREVTGTILVVEDQEDVRGMLITLLERLGFEVETAENGLVACEVIKEHPTYFDVVITDQNMPKMSGIELVQDVAQDYPDIPFVVVTGYALEGMRELMKDHPSVKDVLKKPVDRQELYETLQRIIIHKQFSS